jgi:hypothetical protein
MDDRKILELKWLELAYNKQLIIMAGLIIICIIGLMMYVLNIYHYDFALFIASLAIILTGLIGVMTVDQKMKTISKKIQGL